jgi:chemotaxis protein MotB
MKTQSWKIILICPFILIILAMSTKDLEDTQEGTPPVEKDEQGPQINIDLSTGGIQDKQSEITPDMTGELPDTDERIIELEKRIESMETEIIRMNNSKQILQMKYNKEKNRVRELEFELTKLKSESKIIESPPEQEELHLKLDTEGQRNDSVKKVETGTYNIEQDEDYIRLKNNYNVAKNRIAELELEIIELKNTSRETQLTQEMEDFDSLIKENEEAIMAINELEKTIIELKKEDEENRRNYNQEIQSLRQTIEDYRRSSVGTTETVMIETKSEIELSVTKSRSTVTVEENKVASSQEKLDSIKETHTASQKPPDDYKEPSVDSEELQEKYHETTAAELLHDSVLVGEIFFESGKAVINPDGEMVLKKLVSLLDKHTDKTIRIVGHTDNVNIGPVLKSRYSTNWDLAARRAAVVALYLQNKLGIDPVRMTVVSYAQFRPLASNSTEEGKAKNRRVEIFILNSGR